MYDRQSAVTTRISVGLAGVPSNGSSHETFISADGRYVAFSSDASNLVAGDTNGQPDVFLHDRQSGKTVRASVAFTGAQANGPSSSASISADNRYIVFTSSASNLVSYDVNGTADIFVRDIGTGTYARPSVSSAGVEANGASSKGAINADGTIVTFISAASNLVSGDERPTGRIVRNRTSQTTTRVSVTPAGNQAKGPSSDAAVSADGRYVAFSSPAANLVSGDANGAADIFVHDRNGLTLTLKSTSVTPAAVSAGNPRVSADGRYVVFDSSAPNLVKGDTNEASDVFIYDRQTNATQRVSLTASGAQANGASFGGGSGVSADGRYVAFASSGTNVVSGDKNGISDIFVRDRGGATTVLVSVSTSGAQGNRASSGPSMSEDGRYVAFTSQASNLVNGDTNGVSDVFVRDRQTRTTTRVSIGAFGQGNSFSGSASISADGNFVTFTSWASNLVTGDSNDAYDYMCTIDVMARRVALAWVLADCRAIKTVTALRL